MGLVSEFSDNPDSVSAQHLLCLGNANSPRYWFLTSANDYGNVWDHLRKRDGSNEIRSRALDVQELSDAPFTVYIHKQVAGDLLVVPPRWCENPWRYVKIELDCCPVSVNRSTRVSLQASDGTV